MDERILDFFKAFVDANRMRMAAMLLEGPCTVDQIAARLNMRMSDLPRQLAQIEKLGLLRMEGESKTGIYYSIDPKALEQFSRETLSNLRPQVEVRSNDENADDFDRKMVKNYSTPDGRLREIPMATKKLMPILRHVAQVFEPGVRYNEKQVNEALKQFHADYASLRRFLIDFKMIQREVDGTTYWREKSEVQ